MTHTIYLLFLMIVLPATMKSSSVFAIKCWTCQSNVDPKCADPFDNTTLPITDCEAYVRDDLGFQDAYEAVQDKEYFSRTSEHLRIARKPKFCKKIRQKVKGNWRTIRGCAYLGELRENNGDENNCVMRQGIHDTFMESCLCRSKDLCNSGPNIRPYNYITLTIVYLIAFRSIKNFLIDH